MFNFINFVFSISLFVILFNQYLLSDSFLQNLTFFLKFLFHLSSTSLTIINNKIKTIFISNMINLIEIDQNDD